MSRNDPSQKRATTLAREAIARLGFYKGDRTKHFLAVERLGDLARAVLREDNQRRRELKRRSETNGEI